MLLFSMIYTSEVFILYGDKNSIIKMIYEALTLLPQTVLFQFQ